MSTVGLDRACEELTALAQRVASRPGEDPFAAFECGRADRLAVLARCLAMELVRDAMEQHCANWPGEPVAFGTSWQAAAKLFGRCEGR